jgi:hypothetical protein
MSSDEIVYLFIDDCEYRNGCLMDAQSNLWPEGNSI